MTVVATPVAMRQLGERVAAEVRQGDVVVLIGDVGAGKTTFVQGFAAALGVAEAVTSPTFVIARQLRGRDLTVQHVDVYRLPEPAHFWDLDLDLAGTVTVVEWGAELLATLTDEPVLVVRITRDLPGTARTDGIDPRDVEIAGSPGRWPAAVLARMTGEPIEASAG